MTTNQAQHHKNESQTQPAAQPTVHDLDQLAKPANPAATLQRAMAAPPPAVNPSDVLRLQKAIGNQRVRRMLWRKKDTHRDPVPLIAGNTVQRPAEGIPTTFRNGDQKLGEVARQLVPGVDARARGARHSWAPLPTGQFPTCPAC